MCLCTAGSLGSATKKYWQRNLLDYEDAITAGFYDVGRHRDGAEQMPSLMQLRTMPMLDSRREVILVNHAEDRELQAFSVSPPCFCSFLRKQGL